jgi:two-component system, NtrC family, nitrogen regulation response regulator NtrX
VRELRNVIERILLLGAEDVVETATVERALPQSAQLISPNSNGSSALLGIGTLAQRVEAFERETLLGELKRNHNHMTNTAKALGLERSHLYKKCQQLGIDLRAVRQSE